MQVSFTAWRIKQIRAPTAGAAKDVPSTFIKYLSLFESSRFVFTGFGPTISTPSAKISISSPTDEKPQDGHFDHVLQHKLFVDNVQDT